MKVCKNIEGNPECTCTYTSCSRWGICCECIKYHRERNELPGCFFSKQAERSYDRSIENFIKDYKTR
ncbi:MAG: DUF6485 family protein [Promethearchaeota archaeon]